MESGSKDQDPMELEEAAEDLNRIFTLNGTDSCLVDLDYYETYISKTKAMKITNGDESTEPETVPDSLEKQNIVIPDSPKMNLLETNKTPVEKCTKKKITFQYYQQYRKELGVQIHKMKPSEKIGIKPKSPSPQPPKEDNIPSPKGKGTLCCYCGYVSSILNKCERCGRLINNGKTVDIHHNFHQSQSVKAPPAISKDSFYGTGVGTGNKRAKVRRHLDHPPVRQTRPKFEEPQLVTLSSDEDDGDQPQQSPFKKLKEDDSAEPPPTNPNPKEPDTNDPADPESSGSESSLDKDEEDSMKLKDDKEVITDLARWKEVGLKGTFIAVRCRSTRIGSYRVVPSDRVLFSSEGIMIEIPEIGTNGLPSSRLVKIVIVSNQILKLEMHPGKAMPVIFLYVTPSASKKIRDKLNMVRDSKKPYLDIQSEDECEKRITLLPNELADDAKNAIKQAFQPGGIFAEISQHEANRVLVLSSPLEVREMLDKLPSTTTAESTVITPSKSNVSNKENGGKVDIRVTRGSTKVAPRISVEPMFAWPDGPDRFSVTTDDYTCLNQEQLLNDSIIDFYLRYVFSTKLDAKLKSKCHVFSSFFYQRLTSRPAKIPGRKHPVEDDPRLNAAEKRHSRVKSWTKKVDIFEKDFLIIPINEHSHWFLAIVCFPGLSGPVTVKGNCPVKLSSRPQPLSVKKLQRVPLNKLSSIDGRSFMIGSTTITPVVTSPKTGKHIPLTKVEEVDRDDKDEAESDEEITMETAEDLDVAASPESKEPIKQPCILIFDSLVGCSRNRVMATLRDYLQIEYQVKKTETEKELSDLDRPTLFTKETMPGSCLKVPQQNNYSDCGVYVLQYAESFMKKPFPDYRLPRPNMHNWFPPYMAGRKRKDIQHLLIQLTKEKNPNPDQVLKLLPPDDVRVALNGKRKSILLAAPKEIAPDSTASNETNEANDGDAASCVPSADNSLSSSQQTLPAEGEGQVINDAQHSTVDEVTGEEREEEREEGERVEVEEPTSSVVITN